MLERATGRILTFIKDPKYIELNVIRKRLKPGPNPIRNQGTTCCISSYYGTDHGFDLQRLILTEPKVTQTLNDIIVQFKH